MERRKMLALLGASATAAVAGCNGGGDSDNDTNDTNDTNQTPNGNQTNGPEPEPGNGNGFEAPLVDAFEAESTGGLIAIGEDSESAARENGFDLPPSEAVSEPIVVYGGINDDGTWESETIQFPNLDPQALLDQVGGDLPINPEDVSLELGVPDGFEGELDQQNGLLTVNGQITIGLTIAGGDTLNVNVGISGTTGESGQLTGSLDLDASPVTATVVDNQTSVEALEGDGFISGAINDILGLPSDSGQTWVEIEFNLMDIDPADIPEPAVSSLSNLRVAGNGTDATITEGDATNVEVDVENTGGLSSVFDVTLEIGETSASASTASLGGGESETVTFNAVTGDLAPGDYDVSASTADDSVSGSLTVEAAENPANFQLSNLSLPGQAVEVGTMFDVSADIENTGDVGGTQSVSLSLGSVSDTQEVTLEGGQSNTVTFTVDSSTLGEGTFTATIETDDDSAEGELTVGIDEPEGPALNDAFSARSTGGFIAIGEDSESAARENGFSLPPSDSVPQPIAVDGEVTDDGTWESTQVDFPPLDPGALLDDIGDLPVDPENINIELAVPEGFSGELDQEAGRMTVNGTLTISVGIGDQEITVEVNLQGTTEQSGGLTGSYDTDTEAVPAVATIVDNQASVAAVDENQFPLLGPAANDALGLPSAEGETWLEIVFELTNE